MVLTCCYRFYSWYCAFSSCKPFILFVLLCRLCGLFVVVGALPFMCRVSRSSCYAFVGAPCVVVVVDQLRRVGLLCMSFLAFLSSDRAVFAV